MQPQNAPVVEFFHGILKAAVMFAIAVTVSVSFVAATVSTGHAQVMRGGKNFTLYFEDTPLGEVLDQISALTALDFSIDEAYVGLPVNAELDDLSLASDLPALLHRLNIVGFDLVAAPGKTGKSESPATGQHGVIRLTVKAINPIGADNDAFFTPVVNKNEESNQGRRKAMTTEAGPEETPVNIVHKENPVPNDSPGSAPSFDNIELAENPVVKYSPTFSLFPSDILLVENPVLNQSGEFSELLMPVPDPYDPELLDRAAKFLSGNKIQIVRSALQELGFSEEGTQSVAGSVVGVWEKLVTGVEGESEFVFLVETGAGEVMEVLVSENTPAWFAGGALPLDHVCTGRQIQVFATNDDEGFKNSVMVWVDSARKEGRVDFVDQNDGIVFVDREPIIIGPETFILESEGDGIKLGPFDVIAAGDEVEYVGFGPCEGDTGFHAVALLVR